MNKGELITKEVAKLFKGECGPFGGEDPFYSENQLTLHSQSTPEVYEFSDDGKVTLLYNVDNISELAREAGMSKAEATEYLDEFEDMDIFELLEGKTDLSWFMYLDENKNYKKVIQNIQDILKK